MNVFFIILFAIIIAYTTYVIISWSLSDRIVFPAKKARIRFQNPKEEFPDLEIHWVKTSFGKVEAWYLPPLETNGTPNPMMILLHGNMSTIDRWPRHLDRIRALGFGMLMIEYPGYGHSTGEANVRTLTESLTKGYDLFAERPDIDENRIVVMGRSIGGAAACLLAAHRKTAALILFATFTRMSEMAHRRLLPAFALRHPFDNLNVVSNYTSPYLGVHGTKDKMIPYSHGVRLSRAAHNGELLTLDGDHTSIPEEWDTFWDTVINFLHNHNV